MRWLDTISLPVLVILGSVLVLAPFFPEPHIWEKLQLLGNGELTRPIDIFDLLLHSAPLFLVLVKLLRRRNSESV